MNKQFDFGIMVDVVPFEAISKGWTHFEVPAAIHGNPLKGEHFWNEWKARYKADGRPSYVSGFMLEPPIGRPLGEDFDSDLVRFCLSRTIRRMSEIGVTIIGCWGGHFLVPDGFSHTKAMDQALSIVNIAADYAEMYGCTIALEPQAEEGTLFPTYLEGVEFAKQSGRSNVKVMADLNYFLELDQPLENILKYPDLIQNVHIQGDGGSQPNVGERTDIFIHLFNILKEIGYDKGVSAACPWIITNGAKEIDYKYETDTTLRYLEGIREKVYHS